MKKILLTAIAIMALFVFISCATDEPINDGQPIGNIDVNNDETTAAAVVVEENTPFVLEYPADMQGYGFTEPLTLEEVPQRIVCISASPVLALYELEASMAAVVSSRVVTWPADIGAEVITSPAHGDQFDAEVVVAFEPDLVIMGMTSAETHGKTLEDIGIPVYYVYSGHVVSYDSVRMSTQCLIDAFARDDVSRAAGEAITKRFEDLEAKLEGMKSTYADKSVMVLQSGDPTMHYIQTTSGTLASMFDMMGFRNVYVNDQASMALLDMEVALEYHPDLVACVGGAGAEDHQKIMEEAYALNPEYWNSIDAIANGEVMYLPVTYVSSAGINVIDNINSLIDSVEAHYSK